MYSAGDANYATRFGYYSTIQRAYRIIGFEPSKLKRIWVSWQLPREENFRMRLAEYCKHRGVDDQPIEIISFREQIVPELMKQVGTAHHSDHSLRMFSLVRQCKLQDGEAKEESRQGNFARTDDSENATPPPN